MSDRRTAVLSAFRDAAHGLDAAIQDQDRLILRAYTEADPQFLIRAVTVRDDLHRRWVRLWKRSGDERQRIQYIRGRSCPATSRPIQIGPASA